MEAYKQEKLGLLFNFCSEVQYKIIERQLMGIEDTETFDTVCQKMLECYKGCQVHPGVAIIHKDRTITIDAKLVNLMLVLWARGIETIDSCEGNNPNCADDDAYFVFKTEQDLDKFVSLMASPGLAGQRRGQDASGSAYEPAGTYAISEYVYNNYGFDVHYPNSKRIAFPQKDIDYFCHQLSR